MDETVLGSDRTVGYRRKIKDLLEKSPEAQHKRFLDAAHLLGCDEDEAAFDEKLKVIARQKAAGPVKAKDGQ